MEKLVDGDGAASDGVSAAVPTWWGARHAAAWDAAKDSLRGVWEQAPAAPMTDGARTEATTPKPPTTPDRRAVLVRAGRTEAPQDVARRAEQEVKGRGRAKMKIIAANTEMAAAQVKAEGKIAQARHEAQARIARLQEKIEAISSAAHDAIARDERKGQAKLAKQQRKITALRVKVGEKIAKVRARVDERVAGQRGKIAEARRAWSQVEPAVRFGYGARFEFPEGQAWSGVEDQLRTGWAELKTGGTWEVARPYIHHGWDAVRRRG